MASNKKTLFLIDGSAVVYRSYFAFIKNPLTNSKGQNVSAVFGFLNTMLKLMIDEKPDYVAIVFDTGHPTFRHEMYSSYKATREKMPEELRGQLPIVHELAEHLNIPLLELPGFEADDIIGTLARQGEAKDLDVFMVSGDKDFMQLISDRIKMYAVAKSGTEADITGYDGVEAKFGVHPDQVIDVLGLMGDSSDNVPGVQGIGPKTAATLIKQFGSMEKMYERIDELKPSKSKERLIEQKEMALLSKKLVTIDVNVSLDVTFEDMLPNKPDIEKIKNLLEELEFKNLQNRFEQYVKLNFGKADSLSPVKEKVRRETAYTTVQDLTAFKMMMMKIKSYTAAFDTETTGLNSLNCELVGISFSVEANTGFYLPYNSDFVKENQPFVLDELKKYFENALFKKVGHNIKYDALVLSQYGINVAGIEFDTMIANYLLHPGARNHSLDAMAETYFNHEMIPIEELIGKGKSQISMMDVAIETVAEYACEDADLTFQLFEKIKPLLNLKDLDHVFYDIEMRLLETLLVVEKNGVFLDTEFLAAMSERLGTQIKALEERIYLLVGENFNMNSPKQLGPLLFDKLEIHKAIGKRAPKKTKTGQYSTAESELQKFAEHEIVGLILEYREYTKLKSTYVDAIPLLINPKTGAVHTSFNQTIAATGRLSSTDPNFQNIPIRTELGREIRKAFIPRSENHVIVSADYSQIELRVMAHLSDDTQMKLAFQNNHDIHTSTASIIFKVNMEDVTSDMRRKAKEINFGIIYGMSKYGLASRLSIPVEEAEAFIDQYFIEYPNVHNFMMNAIADGRKHGEAVTISGRKRQLTEINAENRMIREGAERVAINTPIQGSAADLIKIAMINVQREMDEKKLQSKMILQVHDELVFDVLTSELSVMKELIIRNMETAIEMSVPLKVELGAGKNWLEAH